MFWFHLAVTVVIGTLALRICQRCPILLGKLRAVELIVFGAPALFFVVMTYVMLTESAASGHVVSTVPLLDAVDLHVRVVRPQHMEARRRSWSDCSLRLAACVADRRKYTSPEFRRLVSQDSEFYLAISQSVLLLLLSAAGAIWGVHTIGTLRTRGVRRQAARPVPAQALLGSGGMGEVYLAEHQMMKRPCAVKVIRPEKAGDPQVLARFEREVRATAKLSHWNSIDIYDYGRTADGTFYYVMEYLPGHNLGEIVDEHGPLPAGARRSTCMRQVCDALAEAHGHGPGASRHQAGEHLLRLSRRRVRRGQAARLRPGQAARPMSTTRTLTQEGTITGSPLFMSPEQANGDDEVDARSDIYSLGAVMYYMLTGQAAVRVRQIPLKVMIAHASEDPEPPRLLNGDMPPELEEIILRSLEKRPGRPLPDGRRAARSARPRAGRRRVDAASWPPTGGTTTAARTRKSWTRKCSRAVRVRGRILVQYENSLSLRRDQYAAIGRNGSIGHECQTQFARCCRCHSA